MVTKITYHLMPWEIDYALLSFTQFKKSKYHLDPNDIVKIDTTLNLSSYIIDWDKSKLPKEYFIQKYKDLSILLEDYIHTPYIYDGDKLFGILDKQRRCYEKDIDYYIELCPDMYFNEHLLASLIEAAKVVPNKYFVITPQVYKMWDWTWDVLVNPKYQDVPYSEWDKADLFDIRFQTKYNPEPLSLKPINVSKWANWFDLYSKSYYEELIPIPEDWHGYGPGDTYGMVITEYIKSKGVDFQQYVLEGQTIFEYPIGPLKQRNFASYYRDLIFTKTIPNQREEFEARFEEHVNNGIQKLIDKKII
jgi:hypothetical protein